MCYDNGLLGGDKVEVTETKKYKTKSGEVKKDPLKIMINTLQYELFCYL